MRANIEERSEAAGGFQEFFKRAKPVVLREPLAETLGVFKEEEGGLLEYSFVDVVKLAGHACPTTAAAYLVTQEALATLYPSKVPVRGEVGITVFGEPDETVYGVMAQVFSLITGAAPSTGFKGLGHKFKRKDLLKFSQEKPDPQAMSFEFRRLDNGDSVLVKFYPQKVPFPAEKADRLGKLLQQVIWEVATESERKEFRELWQGKVKAMLEKKEINKWIVCNRKEEAA